LKAILAQIEDMKGEETVTIRLEDTSSVADFVVVTTGRSNRHVASIADRVVEGLDAIKVKARVEGMTNADWVLIDAGDCIVHVFRPEVRTFYNLEKMWTGPALRPAG
jgi:ribosome-associated protein